VRFAGGATVAVAATVLLALARVPLVSRYAPLLLGLASAAALIGVVCGMVARNLGARGGSGGADAKTARAARLAVRLGAATAASPLLIAIAFLLWMASTRH
jgi:hypothetical protein